MAPVVELTQKAARHELRKAETLELLAVITKSQEAHGHNMEVLRGALAEHTTHQMRLSSSLWARLKWLAVGR
jgi:hypothetical protein